MPIITVASDTARLAAWHSLHKQLQAAPTRHDYAQHACQQAPAPCSASGFDVMPGACQHSSHMACLNTVCRAHVTAQCHHRSFYRPSSGCSSCLSRCHVLQPMLLAALRECLSAVGMKVTAAGPDQWSITVGSALMRFHDGMVSWHESCCALHQHLLLQYLCRALPNQRLMRTVTCC